MKKLIATLSLALTATFVSAIPDRFIELGTDVSAGVGNNFFSMDSFFNPEATLVIDLNEMAAGFTDEGLAFSADNKVKAFANLNLAPEFQLGFFTQVGSSGYFNLPKAFFELASQGNELDKTYTGVVNLRGDLTAELGAQFGTKIMGATTKISSSFYLPLFHVEKPKATYTFKTASNGTISGSADLDLPVYSVISLENGITPDELLANLFTTGGLDFSVGAEYPLSPELIVGADIQNLPFWPATLTKVTTFKQSYTFSMDNLANNYDSGSFVDQTNSSSTVTKDKPLAILRPFKLGTHAVYMPFGSELIKVIPNLGVGYYGVVYPEFGVKGQLDLWKWIVLEIGTNYEDQLWKQKFGLNLNMWLLELDLAIAGQSQDIGHSFGSGFGGTVGVRFGF